MPPNMWSMPGALTTRSVPDSLVMRICRFTVSMRIFRMISYIIGSGKVAAGDDRTS